MDRSTARQRYAQHKANAAVRGIEFDLTFDEWWEIWEPRFAERGRGKDQFGMCRTRDQGPYQAGNVRLDTPKGNAGDRVLMRRRPWQRYDTAGERHGAIDGQGFKSYGSTFPRPDRALEMQQQEYEWIPGE